MYFLMWETIIFERKCTVGKTENKKLLVTGKIRSTSPIIGIESHIAADSCGATTEGGRVYFST